MIADIVIFLFLAFYGLMGLSRGFLRSLIGPFALISSAIFALIYYFITYHILKTLLIIFMGPILVSLVLSGLLSLWHKKVNNSRPLGALSCFLGALINLIWGCYLAIFVILFFAMAPLEKTPFHGLKSEVLESKSYQLIGKWIHQGIPAMEEMEDMAQIAQDPEKLRNIQSTPRFQKVYQNPDFQELINDPQTQQQLEEKNIPALLSNPKIREVLKNKSLMKDLIQLKDEI